MSHYDNTITLCPANVDSHCDDYTVNLLKSCSDATWMIRHFISDRIGYVKMSDIDKVKSIAKLHGVRVMVDDFYDYTKMLGKADIDFIKKSIRKREEWLCMTYSHWEDINKEDQR